MSGRRAREAPEGGICQVGVSFPWVIESVGYDDSDDGEHTINDIDVCG